MDKLSQLADTFKFQGTKKFLSLYIVVNWFILIILILLAKLESFNYVIFANILVYILLFVNLNIKITFVKKHFLNANNFLTTLKRYLLLAALVHVILLAAQKLFILYLKDISAELSLILELIKYIFFIKLAPYIFLSNKPLFNYPFKKILKSNTKELVIICSYILFSASINLFVEPHAFDFKQLSSSGNLISIAWLLIFPVLEFLTFLVSLNQIEDIQLINKNVDEVNKSSFDKKTKENIIHFIILISFISGCITLFLFSTNIITLKKVTNGMRLIDYKSPYLGRVYETNTYFYKYLPPSTNHCKKSICTYKAKYHIGENSRGHREGWDLLPLGTRLEVTDSYIAEYDSILYRNFNSPTKMIILKDNNGETYEMLEISYESEILSKHDKKINQQVIYRQEQDLKFLQQNKSLKRWYCLDKNLTIRDDQTHTTQSIKRSLYIELRLANFALYQDFKDSSFEISNLGRLVLDHNYSTCALISFNDQSTYLYFQQFFSESKVSAYPYEKRGSDSVCKLYTQECHNFTDVGKANHQSIEDFVLANSDDSTYSR